MSNQSNSNLPSVRSETRELSAFSGASAFESAQRMAKALASSDLVPSSYKGNVANCLVALEIAQRTGSSALAVMQSLNIIHGRPSWSSTYIIAAINACGRFAPLRFSITGQGDKKECFAWTVDKNGERLEGPAVSIAMAKAEGWMDKNGSKWKTMPDLMLRYRAASFFGRLYAPDVLFGMKTDDEVLDQAKDVTPESAKSRIDEINAKLEVTKSARPHIAQVTVVDDVVNTSPDQKSTEPKKENSDVKQEEVLF